MEIEWKNLLSTFYGEYNKLCRLRPVEREIFMLRPAMSQIIKKEDSYYKFVVAVAKRARDIAIIAEEDRVSLEAKPVKLAVEEFAEGKCKADYSQHD